MMIEHRCQNCPAMLRYEQRTNRRRYCEPCGAAIRRAATLNSQKMRDARYGRSRRGCIRGAIAQLEQEEATS